MADLLKQDVAIVKKLMSTPIPISLHLECEILRGLGPSRGVARVENESGGFELGLREPPSGRRRISGERVDALVPAERRGQHLIGAFARLEAVSSCERPAVNGVVDRLFERDLPCTLEGRSVVVEGEVQRGWPGADEELSVLLVDPVRGGEIPECVRRHPDRSAIVDPILRNVCETGVAALSDRPYDRVDVRRTTATVVEVSFENDLAVG